MNLNQLRYFVSVATYQSFSQAAECQFLSQTAITQQIRALEKSLDVTLIDRQKRPVELTPAGKVFLKEAKYILSKMDEAIAKTREAAAGQVGTLRIGYEKSYERSDLSNQLREFHRKYPNILFTCIRLDTDQLASKLLSDDLDVIFAWDSTNLRQNSQISSRLEVRSPLVAALYQGHPFASRESLRREELRHETILFMSPSATGESPGDSYFMKLYERAGYQPRILLTSNDIESLLIMVAAEEGITILPSYSVRNLDNVDHLVFVPLVGDEEYEEIYALWKNDNKNPALKCFMEERGKCQ